MKECDKRKSHISSEFHMTYIYSNSVRHPVTKNFPTLHYRNIFTCWEKPVEILREVVRSRKYVNIEAE